MPTVATDSNSTPAPAMCLSALLTMHVFRASWIPASWFSSKLLLLFSTGEHNSCALDYNDLCYSSLLPRQRMQIDLGVPCQKWMPGTGQNLYTCCTTYKVLYTGSQTHLIADDQQENSKRFPNLFTYLFWRNFLLCSLTHSRGYRYLILGGGKGRVKSRPLPLRLHFLGKYAAIKVMGYITQAADGAHLGLAAERKLTSVVVFCAVAEFLLFF